VENATAELSPVAAVLGGLLAQDAINVLAKLQQPIQNLLLFDGDISSAPIVVLAPQDED
jgi:ubiquitin-like 1-activating enzyme E1 A